MCVSAVSRASVAGTGRMSAGWMRLGVGVLLLLLLGVPGLQASSLPGEEEGPTADPHPVNLRSLVLGTCDDIHQYLESVLGRHVVQSTAERAVLSLESYLGQENVYKVSMFVSMVILFLAEGAASGLNVIAVYVTEVVRVTGLDVKLQFPHFTPEGVASVAQWGLLALIGYWLLSVVLRLLIGLLRRLFWLVKTVAVLWLFALIVGDGSAPADVTAVRLASLVLGCVLLGLAGGGGGASEAVAMETRLGDLEGRLKVVEKQKMD